jgi:hypothetical protein
MATSWSLAGQSLKLNTAQDMEPHLVALRVQADAVQEVILSGNTIGVGAAQALAAVLSTCHSLRVSPLQPTTHCSNARSVWIVPTSSPAASSPRSRRPCPPCAMLSLDCLRWKRSTCRTTRSAAAPSCPWCPSSLPPTPP